MYLKPYEDQIVVRPDAPEDRTAGGLFIPEKSQREQVIGMVVAVGPGKQDYQGEYIPLDIQVGDRILYEKYGGRAVKLGDKLENGKDLEYIVLRPADVIGTVHEGTYDDLLA